MQFTSNEGMSSDTPVNECESEIDFYTGHYVPYSLRRVCGFLNVPQFITCARARETGPAVYRPCLIMRVVLANQKRRDILNE